MIGICTTEDLEQLERVLQIIEGRVAKLETDFETLVNELKTALPQPKQVQQQILKQPEIKK